MRAKLFVILVTCSTVSSCGGGQEAGGNNSAGPAAAAPETRIENLPPRDEGYALPQQPGLLAKSPAVTVDAKYTGKDKADLEAYAQAAVNSLTSEATAANASALNQAYASVWLNEVTKYEGLGSVGALARSPRTGFSYIPTRLTMAASGTGAFESKDPDSATGGRLITVRKYHLGWWRSPNAVTRSCAINTLAHEMTHNMTRDAKTFRWAFTDTGLGDAVTGEKGSYTMGALAQCTYLQFIGRITRDGVPQCVKIWGLKKAFDPTHCDSFDDEEPVKWPKDPKPKEN